MFWVSPRPVTDESFQLVNLSFPKAETETCCALVNRYVSKNFSCPRVLCTYQVWGGSCMPRGAVALGAGIIPGLSGPLPQHHRAEAISQMGPALHGPAQLCWDLGKTGNLGTLCMLNSHTLLGTYQHPTLQMRKMMLRGAKSLAQDPMAGKWPRKASPRALSLPWSFCPNPIHPAPL